MTSGDLTGRVALVTGGNSGIGLSIAKHLGLAGARLMIWGTQSSKNEDAKDILEDLLGREVLTLNCDVADEYRVDSAFTETVDHFGKVDIICANAGIRGTHSVPWEVTSEEWRRVLSVDLDGVFFTLRAGAKHLVSRGEGGAMIVVSSTSAIHGAPSSIAYSTAKTGVLGVMRSFAVALARHSVRVNALMPGWTDTEMISTDKQNPRFVENTISRTPVRRWASPDEYGPAAVYLADQDVAFHTGDVLVLDGGYTIY